MPAISVDPMGSRFRFTGVLALQTALIVAMPILIVDPASVVFYFAEIVAPQQPY